MLACRPVIGALFTPATPALNACAGRGQPWLGAAHRAFLFGRCNMTWVGLDAHSATEPASGRHHPGTDMVLNQRLPGRPKRRQSSFSRLFCKLHRPVRLLQAVDAAAAAPTLASAAGVADAPTAPCRSRLGRSLQSTAPGPVLRAIRHAHPNRVTDSNPWTLQRVPCCIKRPVRACPHFPCPVVTLV